VLAINLLVILKTEFALFLSAPQPTAVFTGAGVAQERIITEEGVRVDGITASLANGSRLRRKCKATKQERIEKQRPQR
jgi:hypothetical protein